MKWFKHETDAKSSEKMACLIAEFGFEGYGRYWRILEIIAERMDKTERCWVELPETKWLEYLAVRRPLFHRYLFVIGQLFNNKVITGCGKNPLIRIEIPNLLKKRDNYTKDLQVTCKKLPEILPLEVEVEVDKEKETPKPPKGDFDCQEILKDLNLQTGKHFKLTPDTKKLISIRLKEGFTVENFKKVHSNMAAKWKGDEKMDQYLRPATLYCASKFQGYLNQDEGGKDAERYNFLFRDAKVGSSVHA